MSPSIDVKRLAIALLESGFIARSSDYALRAHPTSMHSEDPANLARGWAADIAAKYRAAPPSEKGPGVA